MSGFIVQLPLDVKCRCGGSQTVSMQTVKGRDELLELTCVCSGTCKGRWNTYANMDEMVPLD